ncbi:MAG TPA: HigA family addiction module antitoxin [Ktedonobacterales bacterium]|nr:HigA family addiction module antitoxin [Ktedonobacterales bacterium]
MSDTTVATRNEYAPDMVSPPGETLLETLEELGMSQAELARRIGRPKKTVNEIIQGKAAITAETALQFERALGIPAKFWLTREAQYRESLARLDECDQLHHWRDWLLELPLAIMRKRGLLTATRDKSAQVLEALRFFGVASPDAWRAVWEQEAVAFRTTTAARDRLGKVATWLRQGEIEAQAVDCAPYDADAFRAALTRIRALTTASPGVFLPEMTRLCAEAGVAVVVTQEIPSAGVYGATRWLSPTKALLQLSLHYKSDDQFWFSFFHEAGHILLHRKREVFLIGAEPDSDEERQAHAFAADTLIAPQEWRRFVSEERYHAREEILAFASGIGIAPGIVVGRLQHDGLLGFDQRRDLKARYGWAEKEEGE